MVSCRKAGNVARDYFIRQGTAMGITTNWNSADKTLTIGLDEKFNHALYREFNSAYADYNHPNITVKIDMHNVVYMDSAALGMLIQLRQTTERLKGKVILVRPQQTAMEILQTARFDQLFTIT